MPAAAPAASCPVRFLCLGFVVEEGGEVVAGGGELQAGAGGVEVFLAFHAVFEGHALGQGVHGRPECAGEPFGEFEAGFGVLGPVGGLVRDHQRGQQFDGVGVAVPARGDPAGGVGGVPQDPVLQPDHKPVQLGPQFLGLLAGQVRPVPRAPGRGAGDLFEQPGGEFLNGTHPLQELRNNLNTRYGRPGDRPAPAAWPAHSGVGVREVQAGR